MRIRHLVVDHQAVDAIRRRCVQERHPASESPDLKTVGLQQKLQRAEYAGIVVDHVDRWFAGGSHRETPPIGAASACTIARKRCLIWLNP
jgi:hypothetical protein